MVHIIMAAARFISGRAAPTPMNILGRRREEIKGLLRTAGIEGNLNRTAEGMLSENVRAINNALTIDGVDELISRLYPDEHSTTRPVGRLEGFGIDNLFRMNASANNNDCLIHSFLTSVSENFRRITQDSKNEFANFFRRYIFLRLPSVTCYQSNRPAEFASMKIRIGGDDPLENTELNLLVTQFGLNILAADGINESLQPITPTSLTDTDLIPETCRNWAPGTRLFDNTIFIYTDGAHFESIRIGEDRYTITEAEMNEFIRLNEDFKRRNPIPNLTREQMLDILELPRNINANIGFLRGMIPKSNLRAYAARARPSAVNGRASSTPASRTPASRAPNLFSGIKVKKPNYLGEAPNVDANTLAMIAAADAAAPAPAPAPPAAPPKKGFFGLFGRGGTRKRKRVKRRTIKCRR